jgi:hypothetical protein
MRKKTQISTQLTPHVFLALKDVARAEGVPIYRIIEDGVRLWFANNDKRKHAESSTALEPMIAR